MTRAHPLLQSVSLHPSPSISIHLHFVNSVHSFPFLVGPFDRHRNHLCQLLGRWHKSTAVHPTSGDGKTGKMGVSFGFPLGVSMSFRVWPSSNAQNGSFNHRKLNMTGMSSKIQTENQPSCCTRHLAWLFFQCV